MNAGAIGGKLLGAGGGGFMLLFAKPEDQIKIKEQLNSLLHVPFRFETNGSQIIFYDSSTSDRDFYPIKMNGKHEFPAKELAWARPMSM